MLYVLTIITVWIFVVSEDLILLEDKVGKYFPKSLKINFL